MTNSNKMKYCISLVQRQYAAYDELLKHVKKMVMKN